MDVIIKSVLSINKKISSKLLTHNFKYDYSSFFYKNPTRYRTRCYKCTRCGKKIELSSYDIHIWRERGIVPTWRQQTVTCEELVMKEALE